MSACFNPASLSQTSLFTVLIFFVLASIPAIIWLIFFFRDEKASKKIISIIFLTGIIAVGILFGIQCVWEIAPQFNIIEFLSRSFLDQNAFYISLFIWVGISEEIVKQALLRVIDRRTELIKTVNDSMRYSLVAALGFSFAENIFYFYNIFNVLGVEQLIIPFFIRSTFTTAMHLISSAFFGYYYGISKFALDFTDQAKWIGRRTIIARIIAKIFNIPKTQAYKEQCILLGLFIAMFYHGLFDFLLQLNIVWAPLLLVVAGFGYLLFLLKRRTGNLVLFTDLDIKRAATIGKKDEDIVIELVGMWFNKKRYADVIHVCQRLLERDPDNNVVKLFREKAFDMMDVKSAYGQALSAILSEEKIKKMRDQSVLAKYLEEKEKAKKGAVAKPEVHITETEEYKKFLEEEKKKKMEEKTYKLDVKR